MRRAFTILELMLGLTITIVGLTAGVLLAAQALESAARVKRQEFFSAQARVSVMQLAKEISSATAWTMEGSTRLSIANGATTVVWQVDEAAGDSALRRGTPTQLASADARNFVAAEHIRELRATPDESVAITLVSGTRQDKIEASLRKSGKTLE